MTIVNHLACGSSGKGRQDQSKKSQLEKQYGPHEGTCIFRVRMSWKEDKIGSLVQEKDVTHPALQGKTSGDPVDKVRWETNRLVSSSMVQEVEEKPGKQQYNGTGAFFADGLEDSRGEIVIQA